MRRRSHRPLDFALLGGREICGGLLPQSQRRATAYSPDSPSSSAKARAGPAARLSRRSRFSSSMVSTISGSLPPASLVFVLLFFIFFAFGGTAKCTLSSRARGIPSDATRRKKIASGLSASCLRHVATGASLAPCVTGVETKATTRGKRVFYRRRTGTRIRCRASSKRPRPPPRHLPRAACGGPEAPVDLKLATRLSGARRRGHQCAKHEEGK